MNVNNLKEFSEKLKKVREKKHISLKQIKAHTRISLEYLEAIEKADFDVMPPVYMRAFIKEYAEAIGLNGGEILKEYDAVRSGKKPTEQTSPEIDEIKENISSREAAEKTFVDEQSTALTPAPVSKVPQWVIPASVSAVLLIIAGIVYLALFNESNKIIIEEKPYSEVVKENKLRFDEPAAVMKTAPEEKPAVPDSITLKLIATDSCWVKVNFDGDSLKTTDFIMFKGHSKNLKAQRIFKLVLGNSAGIKILLNGDTLHFKGAKGRVKTLIISKQGIVNNFK